MVITYIFPYYNILKLDLIARLMQDYFVTFDYVPCHVANCFENKALYRHTREIPVDLSYTKGSQVRSDD